MKIWIANNRPEPTLMGGPNPLRLLATGLFEVGWEVVHIQPGPVERQAPGLDGVSEWTFAVGAEGLGTADGGSDPATETNYPHPFMDPASARSFRFAQTLQRWAGQGGPPDRLLIPAGGAWAYFVLQKRLLEPSPALACPAVLYLDSLTAAAERAAERPVFQLPAYWTGRLEIASLLSADAVVGPASPLDRLARQFAEGGEWDFTPMAVPWAVGSGSRTPTGRGSGLAWCPLPMSPGFGLPELVRAADALWREGREFRLLLSGEDAEYSPRGCLMSLFLGQRYRRWVESGVLEIRPGAPPPEPSEVEVCLLPVRENQPIPEEVRRLFAAGYPLLLSEVETFGEWVKGGIPRFRPHDWSSLADCWRAVLLGNIERAAWVANALSAAHQWKLGSSMERWSSFLEGVRVQERSIFPSMNAVARRGVTALEDYGQEVAGRVSAVIPFYNLGRYLPQTVASIEQSGYREMEIVVVDDGSDEPESLEALRLLEASGGDRVRVLRGPNTGLAQARNTGALAATGEFILFCDADDCLEPSFLQKALWVLRRWPNVHLVYAWERYFDGASGIWPTFNLEFPYLLLHNMCPSRALVRRRTFLTHGRNRPALEYNLEDYESWLSLLAAGAAGVSLPEPLLLYRVRPGSLWQASTRSQHLFLQESMVAWHRDLYQRYAPELFALQNANGPAQALNRPCARSPYDLKEAWIADFSRRATADWEWSQAEIARLQRALEEKSP